MLGTLHECFCIDKFFVVGLVFQYSVITSQFLIDSEGFKGEPNKNLEVVSQLPAAFRMDIIEPHKFRQGSITMLRKV